MDAAAKQRLSEDQIGEHLRQHLADCMADGGDAEALGEHLASHRYVLKLEHAQEQ